MKPALRKCHIWESDEIWHFYLGDPVEMLELHPDGSGRRLVLGQDILDGQLVQHVVTAGVWIGAQLIEGGDFALMGTTMAPGFSPEDYIAGERDELLSQYPEYHDAIRKLTRLT